MNSCHIITRNARRVARKLDSNFFKFPETSAVRERRCKLFEEEKQRQLSLIGRVEKIQVKVLAPLKENEMNLVMNKDLSTPYNCAMHINENIVKQAVLAMVDDQPWDMHRPLIKNCDLKFLYFTDEDPYLVNKAYWRSCSFVLGNILEIALKAEHSVLLHSWPAVNFRTGSFVYDCYMSLDDWRPNKDELRAMGRLVFDRFHQKEIPFERLDVEKNSAEKIFGENFLKFRQIRFDFFRSENKNFSYLSHGGPRGPEPRPNDFAQRPIWIFCRHWGPQGRKNGPKRRPV